LLYRILILFLSISISYTSSESSDSFFFSWIFIILFDGFLWILGFNTKVFEISNGLKGICTLGWYTNGNWITGGREELELIQLEERILVVLEE
jgi:hypothetical protein